MSKALSDLDPRILGQLLIMQSMAVNLPDDTIFDFICRGMADIPGVDTVSHLPSAKTCTPPRCVSFPLSTGNKDSRGDLLVSVSDPERFSPYTDYVANFAFMLAVILEEREHRRIIERQSSDLARIVEERTEELKRSEHLFQTAFETTNECICIASPQGLLLQTNQRMGELLGFAESELLDRSFPDLAHPDDREGVHASLARLQSGMSESERLEIRLQHKEGSAIWVIFSLAAVRNAQGELLYFVTTIMDITERKWAEEALQESEERFDTALKAVSDGLWDWNLLTGEVYFSPRYYEMLGYEPGDFPPRYESWRDLLHPEDRARAENVVNAYLASRGDAEDPGRFFLEFRMLRKDGEWLWVLSRGQVTNRADDGSPLRLIGTHMDITERKRTEAFIIQSEKMMSVGGLAAGMAHEINNPLAGILGFVQNLTNRLLKDTDKNRAAAEECGVALETIQRYLEKRDTPRMLHGIHDLGVRAAAIVSNMLSFSRKSEKQFSTHELDMLLDNTLELAGSDYNLKKTFDFRNIRIEREYDENLAAVICDANQLQQVFFNLIKNAAEAMAGKEYQSGEPCLTLRTRQDGDTAVVEIEDNGTGMDEDRRKRIFEPFFTTKPSGIGTGLGLSVSYFIIVDQHHGSMEVQSSPGNWTRFTITLPLETPSPS